MKRVLFLTTAHHYLDDRIFYHQAKELMHRGFRVKISSLSSEYQGVMEGIEIESYSILEQSTKTKIRKFREICDDFSPKCIIASEPLAVIAAAKFATDNRCTVIYDVTEWYPSMRMLAQYSFPLKIVHFLKFLGIHLYAGFLSKQFIFGEYNKQFPLANIFPYKTQIILHYFPAQRYIHPAIKKLTPNKITLCYTGVFSKEKGIENFFNAADTFRRNRPDIEVSLLLIGSSRKEEDSDYFDHLLAKFKFANIVVQKPTGFENFTKAYAGADLCFDLRDQNFENHHCLPIKLYYYAASGKPVIYTDLKAIRQQFDIDKIGHLVNPKDSEQIAKIIADYVDSPETYDKHARNGMELHADWYNWSRISELFVTFVKLALPHR